MKKWFGKVVSLILSCSLLVGFVPCLATTVSAASGDATVKADITYNQSEARAILTYMNEWRTGGNCWCWNSSDSSKVFSTPGSCYYDYGLEQYAMQRAAESAVGGSSLGHTRTDGTICFTVSNYTTSGECLGWGYVNAKAMFNGWLEENAGYSGQGHRRIMMGSTYYGIACCNYGNGYTTWCLVSSNSPTGVSETAASNGTKTMTLEVSADYITDQSISSSTAGIAVTEGGTASLPVIEANITCFNKTFSTTVSGSWTSSNKSVCKVGSNVVTGVSAGTATLTATYGGSTVSIPVTVINAESAYGKSVDSSKYNTTLGFVNRLYSVALKRNADTDGLIYWTNLLRNGSSGADVARQFILGSEFTSKNYSNGDFVTVLYRTVMGREPDADGYANWVNALNNGASRESILNSFMDSTEWANICLSSGIVSGGAGTATVNVTPNADVIAFATRLYTTCLGRDPEQAGLEWWSSELANMRRTGTSAALGFFFSPEFEGHNFDDSEYVTRLYRTFMGREPETEGFNYWMGRLASGATRRDVFDGFSTAPEFAEICSNAGIMR